MSARRSSLLIAAVAAGAIAAVTPSATPATAHVHPAGPFADYAHAMALEATSRWMRAVPPASRIAIEQPGPCHRVDRRAAACPIAILVLAHDATGRRPWRCTATVRVSLVRDDAPGRRMGTRCVRFPQPGAAPDPAAALGTAYAVQAAGDVSCLPAGGGRVTCVMRYRTSTGQRCLRAASTPAGRPERAIALGAPRCR
jgi:hypothetical protein